MNILALIVSSLIQLIDIAFNIIYLILVARIILSWLGIGYYYNQITQTVYAISEPILAPFRRLPLQLGPIDFSPIIAFFVLNFIRSFLITLLMSLIR